MDKKKKDDEKKGNGKSGAKTEKGTDNKSGSQGKGTEKSGSKAK